LKYGKEKLKIKGSNLDDGTAGVIANEQRNGRTDEKAEFLSNFRENPFVFYRISIPFVPGAMGPQNHLARAIIATFCQMIIALSPQREPKLMAY
jgi:hypothetical protein